MEKIKCECGEVLGRLDGEIFYFLYETGEIVETPGVDVKNKAHFYCGCSIEKKLEIKKIRNLVRCQFYKKDGNCYSKGKLSNCRYKKNDCYIEHWALKNKIIALGDELEIEVIE